MKKYKRERREKSRFFGVIRGNKATIDEAEEHPYNVANGTQE